MATRRYKTNVGDRNLDVVEEVGAATNSHTIELTVDLATTEVNAGESTRGVSRMELLHALKRFQAKIQNGNWPPA